MTRWLNARWLAALGFGATVTWLALGAGCERGRARDSASPSGDDVAPARADKAVEAKPATPGAPPAADTSDHPGTITFVDVDGTERVRPASEVPESIAWATVGAARVPVVRVVRSGTPARFEIVSYAADGSELARTTGSAPPTP